MNDFIEYTELTVADVKLLSNLIESCWKEYCYNIEDAQSLSIVYEKLQGIIELADK